MADLPPATAGELEKVLAAMLENKLIKYAAESDYKPFFESLFTKEALITASIVHSFYTSFGMSLYEQMAVILANAHGWHAERQYVVYGSVDSQTEALIHAICARTSKPNKLSEIEEIRRSIKPGKPDKDKESIADVFVRRDDNSEDNRTRAQRAIKKYKL
jgi:MjaII restriction endonuclease.